MDAKLNLFIVADGMGGHKGGEVASQMACESLFREVKDAGSGDSPELTLIKGFKRATNDVYLEAQKPGGDDLKGMGTTMVAFLLRGNEVFIANVGDSRAYLHNKSGLWRLTEDHSLVNEQLRSGIITEEDLEDFSAKNVITRSVGFSPEVQVDIFKRKLVAGEKYMLCSDGLHGMVTDEWMQDRLNTGPLDGVVDELILEANKNGGDDNVSCIFIEVES